MNKQKCLFFSFLFLGLIVALGISTIYATTPDNVTINNVTSDKYEEIIPINEEIEKVEIKENSIKEENNNNYNVLVEKKTIVNNIVTQSYNEHSSNTSVDLTAKPIDIEGGFNYKSRNSNSQNGNNECHEFHEKNYRILNDEVVTHYLKECTNADKAIELAKLNNEALKINKNSELEALKLQLEYKKYMFDKIFENEELYKKAKSLGLLLSEN